MTLMGQNLDFDGIEQVFGFLTPFFRQKSYGGIY